MSYCADTVLIYQQYILNSNAQKASICTNWLMKIWLERQAWWQMHLIPVLERPATQ